MRLTSLKWNYILSCKDPSGLLRCNEERICTRGKKNLRLTAEINLSLLQHEAQRSVCQKYPSNSSNCIRVTYHFAISLPLHKRIFNFDNLVMHAYIHTHTYILIYILTYIHTYIHTNVCAWVCKFVCLCKNVQPVPTRSKTFILNQWLHHWYPAEKVTPLRWPWPLLSGCSSHHEVILKKLGEKQHEELPEDKETTDCSMYLFWGLYCP